MRVVLKVAPFIGGVSGFGYFGSYQPGHLYGLRAWVGKDVQ